MWNGKMKAITFSYDDGVEQDIRLIEILDRYHLRGTFNLNPGLQSLDRTFQKGSVTVRHLPLAQLPEVYKNHEVAGHTNTHLHLEQLDDARLHEEIHRGQDTLEQLFGRKLLGLAYPYGTYNDHVVDALREAGVRYARTTAQTENFELPQDLLRMTTTCRHANAHLLDLARQFAAAKPDHPQLFYLWGHSYEFDQFDNWELIEEFCRIVSGREDIFYGTNAEVLPGVQE